jgi:Dirigent-like protein
MRKVALVVLVALVASGYLVATADAGVVTDLTLKEGLCGNKGAHCKLFETGNFGFGTRLISTLPLKEAGTVVGRDQGECVVLHKSADAFYCTFQVFLPGGTLSVQGSVALSGEGKKLPITGGTKDYEGAWGYWHQAGQDVVVHVVTP